MRIRHFISALTAILMLCTLVPVGVMAETTDLEISTIAELEAFRDSVNEGNTYEGQYVSLTADIDLDGSEDNQWTPIGYFIELSNNRPFSGVFDGGGHTISGLYINNNNSYQGLFGYITGTIKNLSIVDSSVTGKSNIGSIVGRSQDGIVENCHNSGSVTGQSSVVGGLVGYNVGLIRNSHNTGDVASSGGMVGGIAGRSSLFRITKQDFINSAIIGCYNSGDVSGGSMVGGIVGLNSSATVENCYNTGNITGTRMRIGGVVGFNVGVRDTNTNSVVKNCYNIGIVSCEGEYVSGVTNHGNSSNVRIENCYYLAGSANGGINSEGIDGQATAITESEFALQAMFADAGWDFDSVWKMSDELGRPVLQAIPETGMEGGGGNKPEPTPTPTPEPEPTPTPDGNEKPEKPQGVPMEGSGTENDPYLIPDLATLEAFRDSVNDGNDYRDKYILLTADIDMSEKYNENGLSWSPIGEKQVVQSFYGTFDGGGHTIKGLYIYENGPDAHDTRYVCLVALFSSNDGTMKNLTIDGAVTSAGDYTAGLVGWNFGTVENCRNACAVSDISDRISTMCAGIAGWNLEEGVIKNCSNIGTVNGHSPSGFEIGGVVGQNDGVMENCYNTATVDFTTDDEKYQSFAGGVAGMNYGTLSNCYNTGGVPRNSKCAYTGGVAGYADSDEGQIENCYYNNEVYTEEDTSAGVTGKDTAAFANGEVAYLLQNGQDTQVWGQELNSDERPVLTNKDEQRVLKVTFATEENPEYATAYANLDGTVVLPTEPTLEGKGFKYWASTAQPSDTDDWYIFDETVPVTEDIVVYAIIETNAPVPPVEDDKKAKIELVYMQKSADGGYEEIVTPKGSITKDDTFYVGVKVTGLDIFDGMEAGLYNLSTGIVFDPEYLQLEPDFAHNADGSLSIRNLTSALNSRLSFQPFTSEGAGWTYDIAIDKVSFADATDLTGTRTAVANLLYNGSQSNVDGTSPIYAAIYKFKVLKIASSKQVFDISKSPSDFNFGADKWGLTTYQYDISGELGDISPQMDIDVSAVDIFPIISSAKKYSIKLVTKGGKINSGNVESYTTGTVTPLPTDVTRKGYTFAGWFDSANMKGNAVTEISADATGDKSFFAKWVKKSASSGGGGGWFSPSDKLASDTQLADKPQDMMKQTANGSDLPSPEEQSPESENQSESAEKSNTGSRRRQITDVSEEAWYYEPVKYAFENGLMIGTSETEFEPEANVTRGMFVTILYRMANEPVAEVSDSFGDVAADEYYAPAVAWASEQGVVRGNNDGTYEPERLVSREEMAAILYRYAQINGYGRNAEENLSYSDNGNISEYAKIPISWSNANGIMQGNDDGNFAPQGFATRAEAAAVFQRMMENFK